MKRIEDILFVYDNAEKKGFRYSDVSNSLSDVCGEDKVLESFKFEKLAHTFDEKAYRDKGEDYFGPMLNLRDANGNIIGVPSKGEISVECIKYWQRRNGETSNPMMRARYAGLLYEFQEGLASTKKDKSLIDMYIESLLLAVEGGYPCDSITSISFLKRSFELNHLRRGAYTNRLKKALLDFDTMKGNDEYPGIWGRSFFLFSNYKDLFTQDEQKEWLDKQRKQLTRLCSKPNNINLINDQVDVLIQHWVKEKDTPSIQQILKIMYDYVQKEKSSMGAMVFVHWIEVIAQRYSTAGLKPETEQLLKEIEYNSPKILSELEEIKMEVNISADLWLKIEKYLIGEGDYKKILGRFIHYFIPNKKVQSEQLKDLAKKYPLQYLMPTKLLVYDGRKVTTINSIEMDFEGQLVLHYDNLLKNMSPILHRAICLLKEKGVISKENIINVISQSPCIEKNRIPIIERGVDAYMQEDYLVAIHLLIPQIEQAIRKVLEYNGGVILRPKNEGFQLRTFDDILRDPLIVETLGEDICYYFQLLFTNIRGFNMRNDVCHGISLPEVFNWVTADLVLHALIILVDMKEETA